MSSADYTVKPNAQIMFRKSNFDSPVIWRIFLHAICFIRNVYKEQFLVLVKFIKLVRNWLVKSSKVYKVLRNKTSQKWHLEKKMPICKKKIHLCTVICYGGSLFKTGINILQISLTNHVYRCSWNFYFKKNYMKKLYLI